MGFLSPSSRDVLWYLTFCGFAVNYMVRVNMNIAIVAMVKSRGPVVSAQGAGFCDPVTMTTERDDVINFTSTASTSTHSSTASAGNILLNRTILVSVKDIVNGTLDDQNYTSATSLGRDIADVWTTELPPVDINASVAEALVLKEGQEGGARYNWDEYQQGLVLGGFFWLHWITQIPGGMLAQRFGTKLVFGLSNLITCLLAVLIPLAASFDYRALIALRVIQGFIVGLAWPAMHNLTANWIPPNDRSKFITAYLGSSVGAALTFPMCGFLIEWFGWPTVFYTTALIGSIWYLGWFFFVFDHPMDHPRISKDELDYILSSLGQNVVKRKPPTPWIPMLTSCALWMNVLAQWGNVWGLLTLLTQTPTYFRYIHGWSIRATGLLSGFPHLCRVTFAMGISWLGDYMLKRDIISRNMLRKVATAICTLAQGVFVLGLAFSGCSPITAVVCLAFAVGTSGAVSTGPLAALVDISPNFASILLGITGMIAAQPGFISPMIVGVLTYNNQTPDQWQIVFLISAAMQIIPGVAYIFCASADLQPWNSPLTRSDEMEALPVSDGVKVSFKDAHHDDAVKDGEVKVNEFKDGQVKDAIKDRFKVTIMDEVRDDFTDTAKNEEHDNAKDEDFKDALNEEDVKDNIKDGDLKDVVKDSVNDFSEDVKVRSDDELKGNGDKKDSFNGDRGA